MLRARLQREPVILPTEGWKNAHSVRHPEWMYQVAPLFDTRPDDQRFADLVTAGFTQTLSDSVPDAPAPPAEGSTSTALSGRAARTRSRPRCTQQTSRARRSRGRSCSPITSAS